MMQSAQVDQWSSRSLESPFGESEQPTAFAGTGRVAGLAPWAENVTPFAELGSEQFVESEALRLYEEALAELRDESFDEAVAFLAEETEQAVADRFVGETPANAAERERFAETYVAGVRFEAEQYLQQLEEGLAGTDVESMSEDQLDAVLDRLEPQLGSEVTPATEEFVGKLVRKARKVVKFVANAAKKVGSVAGKLLGPVLKKLRGLIKPLLRRVLLFAIGRLPAPLQPAARRLATRFTSEAFEHEDLEQASPANLTDLEQLAESFDAAIAEAIADPSSEADAELFAAEDSERDDGGRELERLAEARGALIDSLREAGQDEDLAPTIEQFVPALLGALRIGIRLVGRPKVVNFLAKFLAKLVGRWVGPQLAPPLSKAIVDTGLRLISLEARSDAEFSDNEAAPIAVAGVIEDAIRRFAENEEYVFESDALMQLAASEALDLAVATGFPQRFVRPELRQAPSLGGAFIARRPRWVRSFRKYSRVPEVEITPQIADALPTFGGATVGDALRAASVSLPMRARMHIYEAVPGTALSRMMSTDRTAASGRGVAFGAAQVHPLTPEAAGLILREPRLGVGTPPVHMRTRRRISVGQRFYVLEPIGGGGAVGSPPAATRRLATRAAPSRVWSSIDPGQGRVVLGIYLSESDAQRTAAAIRQGRGRLALLQALTTVYRNLDQRATGAQSTIAALREDSEAFEDFSRSAGRLQAPGPRGLLRRRLRSWILPALANWATDNAEAFVRAASHPDPGVTVRVRLAGVPGLRGAIGAAADRLGLRMGGPTRGAPQVTVDVVPGLQSK
jgi:hypothetical protein